MVDSTKITTRKKPMFTMLDLANAKNAIASKRGDNQVYTPQKSELSFDLAQMSPTDRGTSVELMIVDHMKRFGIDSAHMGGCAHTHDISLYVGGRIVRGEVKSSLLGPTSGKYYFCGVKPELFDILFFAFVHPTNGVVVKTASSRDVKRWASNAKRKSEGYDIYFRGDMTNSKIPTILWDPSEEGVIVA
jgi:hypothetical protein